MPGLRIPGADDAQWLALGAPRCPIVGHGEMVLERPVQTGEHSTGALRPNARERCMNASAAYRPHEALDRSGALSNPSPLLGWGR